MSSGQVRMDDTKLSLQRYLPWLLLGSTLLTLLGLSLLYLWPLLP